MQASRGAAATDLLSLPALPGLPPGRLPLLLLRTESAFPAAGVPAWPPAPTCSVPLPRSLVHSLEGVSLSINSAYSGFFKPKALSICVRQSSSAAAAPARGRARGQRTATGAALGSI